MLRLHSFRILHRQIDENSVDTIREFMDGVLGTHGFPKCVAVPTPCDCPECEFSPSPGVCLCVLPMSVAAFTAFVRAQALQKAVNHTHRMH